MDGRAIARVDLGCCIGATLWAILMSSHRIRVLLADPKDSHELI